MSNETWTTNEGETLDISEMDTSHIENTIRYLERNWDKFDELDEAGVADHWSLPGVFVVAGKEYYRPKLKALKAELKRRLL